MAIADDFELNTDRIIKIPYRVGSYMWARGVALDEDATREQLAEARDAMVRGDWEFCRGDVATDTFTLMCRAEDEEARPLVPKLIEYLNGRLSDQ